MPITCNCPAKCEIHPKPKLVPSVNVDPAATAAAVSTVKVLVPEIAAEDKLTLKTLEAESLKTQIEMERTRQSLVQRATLAHQQLEQFAAAMFDKHGLKQSDWTLDLVRLEFVRREG